MPDGNVAKDLTAAGTTVGLLHSDDYPSLRPGYWVLFTGKYGTREEAEAAVATAADAAPDAYVRRVVPA